MTRINLLPWRAELRAERQQDFSVMLGIAGFIGAIIVAAGFQYYNERIDHQNYRNDVLKQEIKRLDQKIAKIKDLEKTKRNLIARMDVIQELQKGRPQIVHLFHELVLTLPDGVHLTAVKQTQDSLNIKGVAQSNARISTYMQNLDESDWLANPNLQVIQVRSQGAQRVSEYTLTVQQTAKEPEASEGAEGAGDKKPEGAERANGAKT